MLSVMIVLLYDTPTELKPDSLLEFGQMAAVPVGSLTEIRGETSQDVKKRPFKNPLASTFLTRPLGFISDSSSSF